MLILIAFHAVLAIVLATVGRRLGRATFPVAALAPEATVAWAITRGRRILDGTPFTERVVWVDALDLAIDVSVDAYALAFVGLIGVAGLAILIYSGGYLSASARSARFAATMVAFAGAMVGIVVADHLLTLFLFWELTTIASYLLVGHDDTTAKARASALQAALITGAGGLAMLGGFVVLAEAAGTYRISELLSSPPVGGMVPLAWGLVLIGAATKSAQVPFHGWLPGAMAAPTPASAFLHSATMVKAGIFLVGRLAPAAADTITWWLPAVVAIGLATMVVGGWRALRQHDLKLLLAFGTVSQLGFMFLLAGSGLPALAFGAVAVVLAHGIFKSTLFLVVGTIDGSAGTRDIRRLDRIGRTIPVVAGAAVAAAASMAALPLTFGFAAKEAAFDGLVATGTGLIAAVALASVLTVAYTARFVVGALGPADDGAEPAPASPIGGVRLFIPAALALVGLGLGFVPGLAEPLVKAAAEAIADDPGGKLVLWPGLVPALAWSLGSLTLGLALAALPALLDRATGWVGGLVAPLPTAEGTFRRSVAGLLTGADRITGVVQSGSLPRYLTTISLVVAVVPTWAFIRSLPGVPIPPLGPAIEIPLALIVTISALALGAIRRRFAAVLLLGGVGYGIAGIYAIFGGPDLALTQILVETLAIALFALVLRHLPARFDAPAATLPRLLTALSVGAFVFIAGLVSVGVRSGDPVSDYYPDQALPEADGGNVVNVILVDFRALDTLGEITVLAVATLGVAALVGPLLGRNDE